MVGILFGFVELPDGRLFTIGVPFVLTLFLPSKQHRFVPPLVWTPSEYQRLLFPNACAGEIETRFRERSAEVQALGIRVEHIDRRIVCHADFHVLKRSKQELVECAICHIVIFDLSRAAFIIDVVRRVGDYEVCLTAIHEKVEYITLRAVTTDKPMLAELPKVTRFRNRRFFERGVNVKIVVLYTLALRIFEQRIDLRGVETCQRYIEIRKLQIGYQQGELFFVPFAADFIKRDIERFLFLIAHFHDDALDFGHTGVDQHFQTLVSADDVAAGLIPNHRLNIPELRK
ncbi:hypothetical protein SDC9_112864 [bioreactor metagenome]|uniref:Uncharacterized protein n=1 Tax=bioreactor metagenome TaxID=1076179 RepID=A0A645BKG3_9ZZZZ